MSPAPAFSVVVPCYNEASGLALLLEAFAAARGDADFELILVDNGSADGTAAELARLLPLYPFARTLRVPVNRGYGYGVMSGLRAAAGRAVGWTHADLQFPPAAVFEAWRLFKAAGSEKVFVKGLRLGRPAADRAFTWGMGLFASLCLDLPLRDVNGQPVLFGRELLTAMAEPPDDFMLDLYAGTCAARAGFREVRFSVQTAPRRRGESSWNRGLGARLALARRAAGYCLELRRSGRGGA